MFKLAMSPKYWAIVKAEVQAEDGKRIEIKFGVQFNRLPISELKEIGERISNDGGNDHELLRRVVADWKDIGDDDGEPLAFSEAGLRQLFDQGFGPAVLAAFWSSMPKARAKN